MVIQNQELTELRQKWSKEQIVRGEKEADLGAVFEINRLAYGREDEGILINSIRKSKSYEKGFSLVAVKDDVILGHALFSKGFITHRGRRFKCLVLGPVAVLPEHQRRGIGTSLVNEGLERAREVGFGAVVVVGDPVYFGRFGFVPAITKKLRTSLKVPDENFMVREISRNALRGIIGTVMFPREYLTLAEADMKRDEERAARMSEVVLPVNNTGNSVNENVLEENFPPEIKQPEIKQEDISSDDAAKENPENNGNGEGAPPDNNVVM